ncbi:hypothetical protein HDU76_011739, partial [Blyttiomyces sp. JEL0837]
SKSGNKSRPITLNVQVHGLSDDTVTKTKLEIGKQKIDKNNNVSDEVNTKPVSMDIDEELISSTLYNSGYKPVKIDIKGKAKAVSPDVKVKAKAGTKKKDYKVVRVVNKNRKPKQQNSLKRSLQRFISDSDEEQTQEEEQDDQETDEQEELEEEEDEENEDEDELNLTNSKYRLRSK